MSDLAMKIVIDVDEYEQLRRHKQKATEGGNILQLQENDQNEPKKIQWRLLIGNQDWLKGEYQIEGLFFIQEETNGEQPMHPKVLFTFSILSVT